MRVSFGGPYKSDEANNTLELFERLKLQKKDFDKWI